MATVQRQHLPSAVQRLLDPRTFKHLNVTSSLVATALTVMLIATAPEEFGLPECTDTVEAAGLKGPYRWGVILPNSSRVSLLTYKAIVAVRYPELVAHGHGPLQIGHFVANDQTVERGGFRAVFWDAPKDLRNAVEDIVVLLEYLKNLHRNIRQGNYKSTPSLVQPHSCAQPTPPTWFSNLLEGRAMSVDLLIGCWCHCPHCCHCPNRLRLP